MIAQFATAARALTFAEQAMQAAQRDTADCYRAEDGSWWVSAQAPLGAAREMADLGAGRLYVRVADLYVADRGWGDEPPPGPARPLPALTPVSLLDLVRVAGLHRVPTRPLREACVLAPGYLVRRRPRARPGPGPAARPSSRPGLIRYSRRLPDPREIPGRRRSGPATRSG